MVRLARSVVAGLTHHITQRGKRALDRTVRKELGNSAVTSYMYDEADRLTSLFNMDANLAVLSSFSNP